jgi:AcrR family transcriptional regulator
MKSVVNASPRTRQARAPRIESIVEQAYRLFMTEGYAGFTMRKLAKAASISLGHLQHFFPTKEAVLESVFERVSAEYDRSYADLCADMTDHPDLAHERLRTVLQFNLESLRTQNTTEFFFEFWALAVRNPVAKQIMDRMYSVHRANLGDFITPVRPDLSANAIALLAAQVAGFMDGLMIFIGYGKPNRPELNGLVETSIESLMQMIDTWSPVPFTLERNA